MVDIVSARSVGIGVAAIIIVPVAVAITPLVAVVALPIFASKALYYSIQHRSLYNRTVTNQTREKFGRVAGQDYTRWDGKATQVQTSPTWQDRMHEKIGSYIHGFNKDIEIGPTELDPQPYFGSFHTSPAKDCPFKTREDLNWLNHEYARREVKDKLDSDLERTRAFAKALIPIAGLIWILFTETGIGGPSEVGCRTCRMGRAAGIGQEKHWGWRDAISYHRNCIKEPFNAH